MAQGIFIETGNGKAWQLDVFRTARGQIVASAVEYREAEGRVQLVFPGKPADDVRAMLRRNAFKWSPTRGAWVRALTGNAQYAGRKLAEQVGGAA